MLGRCDDESNVVCPSLPSNIAKEFYFIINNPLTKNCTLCTGYTKCSWCDTGRITNISILTIKMPDLDINNYCWDGNPFSLVNNTYSDRFGNSFAIVCNDIPKWKQCAVSGPCREYIFNRCWSIPISHHNLILLLL